MMVKESVIENVREMIRPIVEALNYELYYVEYVREDNENYLRIYIEKPEGITLDDCENVSRPVSEMLDAKDPIQESYYLEVSSPGVYRTLFTDEHLKRYKGHGVLIKLKAAVEGKKVLKGILEDYTDTDVIITTDNVQVNVPKAKVKTISLEGEL